MFAALLVLGVAGCFPNETRSTPTTPSEHGPPGLTEPLPPVPALELPYFSASDQQFAVQASTAARHGDCRTAVEKGKRITVEARHRLRAADAAYARCLETQP